MVCPNCGSQNVNAQIVNEISLKNKHHNIIWWFFIGFWWIPLKWLLFTLPALIIKIFGRKKMKTVNKQKSMWVCQSCGNQWVANSRSAVANVSTANYIEK